MIATLPDRLLEVFERSVTTEYATVDHRGQPITWPVTPTTGPRTRRSTSPRVSATPRRPTTPRPTRTSPCCSPTRRGAGSTTRRWCSCRAPPRSTTATSTPTATATRASRPPSCRRRRRQPPGSLRPLFDWYATRIYVTVRPERVYSWPEGDPEREPELFDAHLEEVRSGHNEEPEEPPPGARAAAAPWDDRLEQLGDRHETAALAVVGPDGFPFPPAADRARPRGAPRARCSRSRWAPPRPELACLTAHAHAPDFKWQTNFQVRGDLVRTADGWGARPASSRRRLRAAAEKFPGLPPQLPARCCASARRRSARRSGLVHPTRHADSLRRITPNSFCPVHVLDLGVLVQAVAAHSRPMPDCL